MAVSWFSKEWSLNYGGPKAKRDIASILEESYNVSMFPAESFCVETNSSDSAILQYPTKGLTDKISGKDQGVSAFEESWTRRYRQRIVVVHDLKSQQLPLFQIVPHADLQELRAVELSILRDATCIIVHSSQMRRLVSQLFPEIRARYEVLGSFDYLIRSRQEIRAERRFDQRKIKLAFVGNFNDSEMCHGFDTMLKQMPFASLTLYGYCNLPSEIFQAENASRIFTDHDADSVPGILRDDGFDFGLCWWPRRVLTSVYFSTIAPHKASCYFASGLPVIAPEKSYLGSMVRKLGVGIAVASLEEIKGALLSLSCKDVFDMRRRASALGERIISGEFTRQVFDRIL